MEKKKKKKKRTLRATAAGKLTVRFNRKIETLATRPKDRGYAVFAYPRSIFPKTDSFDKLVRAKLI